MSEKLSNNEKQYIAVTLPDGEQVQVEDAARDFETDLGILEISPGGSFSKDNISYMYFGTRENGEVLLYRAARLEDGSIPLAKEKREVPFARMPLGKSEMGRWSTPAQLINAVDAAGTLSSAAENALFSIKLEPGLSVVLMKSTITQLGFKDGALFGAVRSVLEKAGMSPCPEQTAAEWLIAGRGKGYGPLLFFAAPSNTATYALFKLNGAFLDCEYAIDQTFFPPDTQLVYRDTSIEKDA